MRQILLATRNPHKTREFGEILGEGFEVRDLTEGPAFSPVEETGLRFEANAVLKAVDASRHFPGLVVADDSGLEVDALEGAPGVFSARYAGEHATDQANVAKLLRELSSREAPWPARFRCCVALARAGEVLGTFEGVGEGTIVAMPRGSGGFGYDPVFRPDGFDQTFAQLSPFEKNRISHRARAISALRAALQVRG
jgi:XTP/dITP diphosphohydrolase